MSRGPGLGVAALFVIAALALMGAAVSRATYWSSRPLGTPCGNRGNCAKCHTSSAPRTHTIEFVQSTHGPMAHFDRQGCFACHQETGCNECHLKEPPSWHHEAFRHPARGLDERLAHSRLASSRSTDCMECHQHTFQSQCSQCHRLDEWVSLRTLFDEISATKTGP